MSNAHATQSNAAPTAPISTISQQLVSLKLTQSFWTAKASDTALDAKVAEENNADDGVTKTTIKLLKGSTEYNEAQTAKSRLYDAFTQLTFPWEHRGRRVASGFKIMDIMEELTPLLKNSNALNSIFCNEAYPAIYEKVIFAAGGMGLGDLASRVSNRYPDPSLIHSKFSNDLVIGRILPAETNVRFPDAYSMQDLEQYTSVRIEDELSLERERTNAIIRDAWEKLAAPIQSLAQKCEGWVDGGKGRWHDSSLQNIRDVIASLHILNINNDPRMTQIADEALAMLTGLDTDTLKGDSAVRHETRARANELIERMRGYM